MRSLTRCILAVPLLGWIWISATEARAQCSYDTSVPYEGDVLAEAPAPIVISFLLGIHLQSVRLVDGRGTVWPVDWTAAEDNVFKAEFRVTEPLPPGRYQIEWAGYVRQHHHPDGGVITFAIARDVSGDVAVRPAAAPPAAAARPAATGWPYRALQGGVAPTTGR